MRPIDPKGSCQCEWDEKPLLPTSFYPLASRWALARRTDPGFRGTASCPPHTSACAHAQPCRQPLCRHVSGSPGFWEVQTFLPSPLCALGWRWETEKPRRPWRQQASCAGPTARCINWRSVPAQSCGGQGLEIIPSTVYSRGSFVESWHFPFQLFLAFSTSPSCSRPNPWGLIFSKPIDSRSLLTTCSLYAAQRG